MKSLTNVLRSLPLALALLLLASSAQATSDHFARRGSQGADRHGRSHSLAYATHRREASGYGVRRSGYTRISQDQRRWVPAHYASRENRVWVPGTSYQVWHPAQFETRFHAWGGSFRVQIGSGYYTTEYHPGRYEIRSERVWCSAGWGR